MVSEREAVTYDRVRKLLTVLMSAVATILLLRVLFRLAHGRFSLADLELWGFLALFVLATWWIRSARRMPRRQQGASPDDASAAESPEP